MEPKYEPGKLLEWVRDNYEGKMVTDSRSEAGNWMQLTLEAMEKGSATISMLVRKEMTNPYGNIHGGMMSLVIDECIGWAIVSLEAEHHYTSMNLTVDFLYAIKEGERLTATAQIIRHGKKIINAECHVYDAEKRLLAKASSNLVSTSMKLRSETER